MLTELRRKIGEHNENINKELKNINMDQYKVKNKMRNTLEGMSVGLGDPEECLSILEVRTMENTQSEEQKGKQLKKLNI